MGFQRFFQPFGQVKGWQPLWGVGQSHTYSRKTLRKGWIQKQSGGLFLKRWTPCTRGRPLNNQYFFDKRKCITLIKDDAFLLLISKAVLQAYIKIWIFPQTQSLTLLLTMLNIESKSFENGCDNSIFFEKKNFSGIYWLITLKRV